MSSLALGYSADVAQLGLVVERLPIGVIIFDKKRKTVVFANAAARRLLRPTALGAGDPLPEPWSALSLRRYAERLVDSGVAAETRVRVDGDHAYKVSGITTRETNSGVILIEDLSSGERHARTEREFVANAAHELLTPLTGIVGAAHVLQAGAKEIPEDRDRFIEHIAHECSRLARIARSLLVLARAQSGEEPPRLEILPLADLLEDALGEVHGTVTLDCERDLMVFADADLFVQATVNLVSNAIRHGSGEVAVRASRTARNLVEIDIDHGGAEGIDPGEWRARFRSSGGRDGGGFGLGLSIAEQSLEVMGGHLFLQTGGSRIELPQGELTK